MPLVGRSPMSGVIENRMETPGTLDELTVLARDNDPFRQDRSEGHKLGQWLHGTWRAWASRSARTAGPSTSGPALPAPRVPAPRVGQPDGSVYPERRERRGSGCPTGCQQGSQVARVRPVRPRSPTSATPSRSSASSRRRPRSRSCRAGRRRPGPERGGLRPASAPGGQKSIQPCRLAVIGEKSSLEPVLGPVAAEYGADLYLPTGEISDTILHQMASRTAAEKRPLIVFYFADCDPSGGRWAISVARKLHALSELWVPSGSRCTGWR